jgi:hypothetical protein
MAPRIKTFPDLVRNEAIAVVSAMTAVFLISAVSDAPIGGPADSSGIPVENVKAPWIFLGIQQMLRYFPAVIGGVIIPFAGLLMLISIPFVSKRVDQPVQVVFWAIILISLGVTVWGYFV